MKIFQFTATDRAGYQHEGRIVAQDQEQAEEKLHSKGYYLKSIREEKSVEETFEFKAPAVKKKGFLGFSLHDWISYSIPAAGMIFAVVGIVVTLRYLNPQEPELSREALVTEYLNLEQRGDFAGQFELFSRGRRNYYGSLQNYLNRRKGMGLEPALAVNESEARQTRAGAMEAEGTSKKKSLVRVKILRPMGALTLGFYLVNAGGEWKIEYLRDPAVIDAHLAVIESRGGYEQSRDLVRLLKLETGLSDLDIEEALRAKRKKEMLL